MAPLRQRIRALLVLFLLLFPCVVQITDGSVNFTVKGRAGDGLCAAKRGIVPPLLPEPSGRLGVDGVAQGYFQVLQQG
ncbi:hypothetical protein O3W44_20645 [Pantoea sp. LMR881]|uniref:hypothetical protein n=1 Tax=Pantoea sp. LMR881 TaxID=3014336 RepID=UPI0022AFE903|nr:hypothetical protein [Pantoea sp. LMR881]MCZ4060967.1 hypothetical protein [Pantoea sp. LMR881]